MKTIHIEALYPECNNLYGDTGNLLYLEEKLRRSGYEVRRTDTALFKQPAFVTEPVDILYIGPCTEQQQEWELAEMAAYRDALRQRMDAPQGLTLVTGNAPELFGRYIEQEDGSRIEGLSLLPLVARRFGRLRFNDLCLGRWQDIDVVGFKNQMSHSYLPEGEADPPPFLIMEKGSGRNPDVREEGVWQNGFFATYLIGPLLPLNPRFTKALLEKLLGEEYRDCPFPFEEEAYRRRLAELRGISCATGFSSDSKAGKP